MNLFKNSLTAIFIVGAVFGSPANSIAEEPWQTISTDDEQQATPASWEQRVLKGPQQSLDWQSSPRTAALPSASSRSYRSADSFAAAPQRIARRSADEGDVFEPIPAPAGSPSIGGQQSPQRQFLESDPTQYEPVESDGVFAEPGFYAGCGDPCSNLGACGVRSQQGAPASDTGCDFGYEIFDGDCGGWLRNLRVSAGAHGFKGPLDRGVNGNFGLNEGINLGGPLGDPWGFGYQIGANFLQSDFSSGPTVQFNDEDTRFHYAARNQTFVTAAIFRRALCGGLQGGIAYDYLHDGYFEQFDLQQIRSETGLVLDDIYEIGYYGAYGVSKHQVKNRHIDGKLDPTDMFLVYVRRNFENGGDGRIWGGVSGNGDGLLGADVWVPLGRSFALENRVNYLIPKQGKGELGQTRESWGLMMQLVWYPGRMALCQHKNPFRPMFNVADNSLFMVDRLAAPTHAE